MHCQSCGVELSNPDTSEYCPQCGEALTNNTPNTTSTTQDTSTATQNSPDTTTTQTATSSSRWHTTQLLTAAGGLLTIGSLFLPWVTANAGSQSVNALATQFGTPLLAAASITTVLTLLTWGRGAGWLTMLLAGIGGGGVAYIGIAAQSALSRTVSFGTIQLRGADVPIAAVSPGIGVTLTIVGGLVIVAGALLGLLATLTSTTSS